MKIKSIILTAILMAISLGATAQKRPKVGLVLSGGGAKGVAHIGVIKVIEEAGIPVDYVVGTSMGSIIGGLYSIGYTPSQMDSMVRKQNWPFVLSDKIRRSKQNITSREDSETYLITVPWGKNISKTIFSGLVRGENISNLFNELTVGYHEPTDFNKLPIPFACVAEDIVSGQEVDIHHGRLPIAMRASMAIPGVFSPVRKDSMVLVDGGVVNNYPVDVARKMGADIIIGVDVQNDLRQAWQLKTARDIINQMVGLLGKELYEKNLKKTDAYIKVDVEGYSSSDFNHEDIDSLIQRGERAARKIYPQLANLRKKLGLRQGQPTPRPAQYNSDTNRKLNINDISVIGLEKMDEKWLFKKFDLKENSKIKLSKIVDVAERLRADLGYTSANYELVKTDKDHYDLIYKLAKKNENTVKLGVRIDSEEIASAKLKATHQVWKQTPSYLSFTARLGKRLGADLDYNWIPTPLREVGIGYAFHYNDIDFYKNGKKTNNSTYRHHCGQFQFSDVWLRNLRFTLGLRYEYYNYDKFLYTDEFHGGGKFNIENEHFFTTYAGIKYETLDKAYFPTHGIAGGAEIEYYTDNLNKKNDHRGVTALSGGLKTVIKLTNRFNIIPSAYGRFIFGRDLPYAKLNILGGPSKRGSILPQQLPFNSINTAQIMDNQLLTGSLNFRQRMGSDHYLTLLTEYALTSDKIKHVFDAQTMFGIGARYSYDSLLGPLEITAAYNNRSNKLYIYLNLGYRF